VKTVHGAEFYANKKHKGPGDGTEDGSSGTGGLLDSSPHSEEMMSGKTASLSSPSVKSEVINDLSDVLCTWNYDQTRHIVLYLYLTPLNINLLIMYVLMKHSGKIQYNLAADSVVTKHM
jgi:hypothetical protein